MHLHTSNGVSNQSAYMQKILIKLMLRTNLETQDVLTRCHYAIYGVENILQKVDGPCTLLLSLRQAQIQTTPVQSHELRQKTYNATLPKGSHEGLLDHQHTRLFEYQNSTT